MFPHLKTMEPRDRKRIAYGQAVPTGQVSLFSCVDSLAECQKALSLCPWREAGAGTVTCSTAPMSGDITRK